MRTLRVADLEAKPGEKVSGFVHIIGAEFGIPVTLICGEKEGETVLISGGVHNAEYVGIQAAMQLADELDPKKIAGNIIVIRLMNRTGFEHRTMSLTYEDGKNLNRVFPGNPNGTLSDRIAYTVVTEFFPKADYYVDLHCGDGFEGLVSYVYCTGAATPEVAAKSREMAEIAHVDYLVTSMCGTGGAYNYAGSMGIPSILLERGHSSRWCEDLVAEDVHDVKNILRHLGVLCGKSHTHGEPPQGTFLLYDSHVTYGVYHFHAYYFCVYHFHVYDGGVHAYVLYFRKPHSQVQFSPVSPHPRFHKIPSVCLS